MLWFSFSAFAAGWYQDMNNPNLAWLYRQKITVNHLLVSGELTSFPVLVKITSTSNPVFSKAQLSTGWDILFTKADGAAKITHEVEYYNSSTSTLCAWVRAPSVSATTDAVMYMYYGCPNATTQESRNGVWDSNFIMVQHLKETSGQHMDSTVNAHNSRAVQVSVEGTYCGAIDGADTFRPISYVSCEMTCLNSAEGCVMVVASMGAASATRSYMFCHSGTNARLYLLEGVGSFEIAYGVTSFTPVGFVIPTTTWHVYAFTWLGTSWNAYVDGVLKSSGTANFAGILTAPVIGCYTNFTQEYYTGMIDEVRTSNLARTQPWLSTEANSILSPSAFCTFAAEERRPSVMIINRPPPAENKLGLAETDIMREH